MIPKNFITEWSHSAPWKTNEQIEQDLIICRALIEIFQDDFLASRLAFRGGTALYKLYFLPPSRYSEDIDLVQISAEPIKPTIRKLQERLSFLGASSVRQRKDNNTLVFRFESEYQPVQPLRLKVEINCREHFSVLGWQYREFSLESGWVSGSCQLTTYEAEELLGTKLRALYQRNKGRDLFDLYRSLTTADLDLEALLHSYRTYMAFSNGKAPTPKQFLQNLEAKLNDRAFRGDTTALLRPEEIYEPHAAFELVKRELIDRM